MLNREIAKRYIRVLVTFLAINTFAPVSHSTAAGSWVWAPQASVGNKNWHSLTSNADGSHLFAGVDGGDIYSSNDYGVTWTDHTDTAGGHWFSITSNIYGTKIAAVDRGGYIYTSADSGTTWIQRQAGGAPHNWESIAGSSDGVKLVAVSSDGLIYTSGDSGATWSDNSPAGSLPFTGVSSSDDGMHLAATTWNRGIFISSDSGHTWTHSILPVIDPSQDPLLQSVASSGDGSHLVTGTRPYNSNGGLIFTSSDYGTTWVLSSRGGFDYICFASSGDGSHLAAALYGQAGVATSSDFGATWSVQSTGDSGMVPIASNIDGSLLFIGSYGGNLWTGKVPGVQVVAVLATSTSASLTATSSTPATSFSFPATVNTSAVTLTPIPNPAPETATPFAATNAHIFDVAVVYITGQVTICVAGSSSDRLWHYTNGAWVDITTSHTATQVCGVTTSFSPFAAAAPPALVAAPVPDPVQQSKITALSVSTAIAGTAMPVEITGSFVEKIRAIQINGLALAAGSWTQTASSVAFTMPGKSAGTYQIQLFNGSAPVLKVQNFTFTAPIVVVAPTPAPTAKPKVTYIRCAKPGHGTRVAYGVNPTCPAGYVKK